MRKDPLEAEWSSELFPLLKERSALMPTTLLEMLQDKYPGQYPNTSDWHSEPRNVFSIEFKLRMVSRLSPARCISGGYAVTVGRHQPFGKQPQTVIISPEDLHGVTFSVSLDAYARRPILPNLLCHRR